MEEEEIKSQLLTMLSDLSGFEGRLQLSGIQRHQKLATQIQSFCHILTVCYENYFLSMKILQRTNMEKNAKKDVYERIIKEKKGQP